MSRKLFLLNLKTLYVAVLPSRKVIIIKSKVVYPSSRLLGRNFDENNCVNTSINLLLTGDKNPLFKFFVSFSTQKGFVS